MLAGKTLGTRPQNTIRVTRWPDPNLSSPPVVKWVATGNDGCIVAPEAQPLSVGLDLKSRYDVTIAPGELSVKVDTGLILHYESFKDVSAIMLHLRSSVAAKTGLRLSNGVGVIEPTFPGYKNGAGGVAGITLLLDNLGSKSVTISIGDRIGQLAMYDFAGKLFTPACKLETYLSGEADWVEFVNNNGYRLGGLGSTGK